MYCRNLIKSRVVGTKKTRKQRVGGWEYVGRIVNHGAAKPRTIVIVDRVITSISLGVISSKESINPEGDSEGLRCIPRWTY
jgi:hypothetical protein